MKKGVLIIIGIIMIIVILFLVILFFKGGVKGTFDEATDSCIKECDDEACISNCKDLFYSAKAKQEESIESCYKISDPEYSVGCTNLFYYNTASKDKDVSLCNNINSESLKETCKRKVVYNKGIEEKNSNYCDEISDWPECKDIININIAYYGWDLSFCELIVDSEMKSICLNNVAFRIERKEALEEIDLSALDSDGAVNPPGEPPPPPDFSLMEIDPIYQYIGLY